MAPRRTSSPRAVARLGHLPSTVPGSRVAAALLPSGRALVAAAALALTAGALYAGARSTSVFAVQAIDVRGASPALAADVRAALAPVVGRSLLVLERDDVVPKAERIPAVAAAEYDRGFPHTLVVFVRQERPAALVRRGAEAWVVARSGRVLEQAERGTRPGLPRVWVPVRTPVALGQHLGDESAAGAVAAVAHLPAAFPDRVRDVRSTPDALTFKLGSGVELRLGDRSDLDLKLAIAARILPTLTADGSGTTPYLDVSVVARPVAGGTLNSLVEVEG